MTVKTLPKIFFRAFYTKNKKPPSVPNGQWLRSIPFAGKALSAEADNDDNANADKNVRDGHHAIV